MNKTTFELPTLYGDHHVLEVRRILLELPGIEEVYASSSFHMVEVSYDPAQINDLEIQIKLDEAGYLGEWSLPIEPGIAAFQKENVAPFTRHTAVYETNRRVVSFKQTVEGKAAYTGRPLWNCPGMGVMVTKKQIQKMEE